ncbi:PREDICTED: methionine adenosyltransferase 2 subunit beta [Chaetura pelagica]|uniref:methionine adenosyltransferase 2 subunit beta n=1 Tax=Chaetura pelagica TaxID=8897 RepID=UPI000523EE75|nr:PREDICTED: methionine adenosyltransferase 2 subunit beta [Chaetura pelagica]
MLPALCHGEGSLYKGIPAADEHSRRLAVLCCGVNRQRCSTGVASAAAAGGFAGGVCGAINMYCLHLEGYEATAAASAGLRASAGSSSGNHETSGPSGSALLLLLLTGAEAGWVAFCEGARQRVYPCREDVDIPSRRVLITGATGLLGRAVFKEFKENNWNAVGCGFRRAQPRFEQINLLDCIAVHDIIHDFQPHVIVHCAAERRPDVVESQPDAASQLNVAASGNLAKEAAGVGAFLIYISTDYVFDGTSPPYKETDVPNPLNLYGKTKLEGEKAVLENNEDAAVLRIPVLYGEVERLEESAVTVMFDKVQFSNKSANMDHWQQRFPTNVKDVATVCRQLAEKRMLDPSVRGTFHWSGNEQMTKYEMACAIADAFNLPSSHLRPITDCPVVGALRPRNAQLDCSKLEMLGIGQRTPFRAGIKESLWPFLVDKRWRQTVFH